MPYIFKVSVGILHPIASLQGKGKKFDWNGKCTERFNKLKHLLTTTPILKFFDPFKDFVVCIAACKEGLGGVLIQEIYVIDYESRKLKKHKKNYATHDLKLDSIIHALKKWQHYLNAIRLSLMSNNISLKYLFDKQKLNTRQAR